MEEFARLFGSLLSFVYHCFDRIVILGHLPAAHPAGEHRALLARAHYRIPPMGRGFRPQSPHSHRVGRKWGTEGRLRAAPLAADEAARPLWHLFHPQERGTRGSRGTSCQKQVPSISSSSNCAVQEFSFAKMTMLFSGWRTPQPSKRPPTPSAPSGFVPRLDYWTVMSLMRTCRARRHSEGSSGSISWPELGPGSRRASRLSSSHPFRTGPILASDDFLLTGRHFDPIEPVFASVGLLAADAHWGADDRLRRTAVAHAAGHLCEPMRPSDDMLATSLLARLRQDQTVQTQSRTARRLNSTKTAKH
jgi:hypothetical protein